MLKVEHNLTLDDRAALCAFLRTTKPTGAEIQQWFRERGMRIGKNAAGNVRRRLMEFRRPSPGYEHLRIETLLRPDDREPYYALLRRPGTRVMDALAWFKERGYGDEVRYCSVCRHRRRFLDKRREMRDSAEMGAELSRVARERGKAVLTDGALTTFEQVVMEQLRLLKLKEKVDPKELAALSQGVATAVVGRERLETLLAEIAQRDQALADAADHEARRQNATPQDVAERMRQMLGLQTKARPLSAATAER
jgi:hypothetical protein